MKESLTETLLRRGPLRVEVHKDPPTYKGELQKERSVGLVGTIVRQELKRGVLEVLSRRRTGPGLASKGFAQEVLGSGRST